MWFLLSTMANLMTISNDVINGGILSILFKETEYVKIDYPNLLDIQILIGLMRFEICYKELKEEVEDMVKYSALRFAIWDVGQVGVTMYKENSIDVCFH